MNWFAINEDAQFEIASIQTIDQYDPITIEKVILAELKNNTIQAVENLRKQQNKGKDYFYRIQEIVFNRFFTEKNAWLFIFERYGKSHLSQEWTCFSLRLKSASCLHCPYLVYLSFNVLKNNPKSRFWKSIAPYIMHPIWRTLYSF